LRERACAVGSPFVAVQISRHPVDDVRNHAVGKLAGDERAQFAHCRLWFALCKHDGVEAGIPEPLVGIGVRRRNRVGMPVGRPAVRGKQGERFISDGHTGTIPTNAARPAPRGCTAPGGFEHRVTGGPEGTTFLEIAFGDFDESDITRLEDRYGRT